MKVTTFRIGNPKYEQIGEPVFGSTKAYYKVPTLPAYAIIDSRLDLENSMHTDAGYVLPHYELLNDCVATAGRFQDIFQSPSGILTIYHNGIKDYKLLFPHIENDSLKVRLGQFAEEASNAFESQSWVSYVLMVGGVLEGLLYNQFGNKKFQTLINEANDKDLITDEEATLIDRVRIARNKIHACKYNEIIADRKTALELSTAYDRLVKRDWNFSAN